MSLPVCCSNGRSGEHYWSCIFRGCEESEESTIPRKKLPILEFLGIPGIVGVIRLGILPPMSRRILALALVTIVLLGCRKEQPLPPPLPVGDAEADQHPPRPAALLGVYGSLFLAQSGFLPVFGALKAARAMMEVTSLDPTKSLDETFALFEEYGTVLGENIPELLDRSDDRPRTLTAYVEGLDNITTRANRRQEELKAYQEGLRDKVRDAERKENEFRRQVNRAQEVKDYSTAGALQKELSEAQVETSRLQAEDRQIDDILSTFRDLIELAEKRRDAIEKNREVLIAGVVVADVPGIEELGIIKGEKYQRRDRSDRARSIFEIE